MAVVASLGIILRQTTVAVVLLAMASGTAAAADPEPTVAPSGPRTLTDDWFGQGPALREAGFDFRLEWSQFYQGLTQGTGDKGWQYGGKWDAQATLDLTRLGFWDGVSVTAQGVTNYGQSINRVAIGGSLLAVNTGLFFPGIDGRNVFDLMALYVTQKFGDVATLRVGKINMIELARYTPLKGGGGVDTFWNTELAAPISGLIPPTLNGAMLSINTQPVSYSLMVFDPQDATNKPLFSDLLENGVSVMASATLRTSIYGRTGFYGVKGIYSTRRGRDFSALIPPPGATPLVKQGSWYVGFSVQQYLVQDPNNPARGWGLFGEIAKADGNPNYHNWSVYVGLGGSSPLPDRPDDRFGVAYYKFGFSNVLKGEVAPVIGLRDQSGVEFFYNAALTPWLRLAADLQFIRPGLRGFSDALYAGFGTYVRF